MERRTNEIIFEQCAGCGEEKDCAEVTEGDEIVGFMCIDCYQEKYLGIKKSEHPHDWTLAFTGMDKGEKSYHYHCKGCDEWNRLNEPLKPESEKGFYEGNPLTKIK